MTQTEVDWVFFTLDEYLFSNLSLKLLDTKLVAGIDLLRKVSEVLVSVDDSAQLMNYSVKVTDGLLKSIWWMTSEIQKVGRSKSNHPLNINIRKSFKELIKLTKVVR